MGKLYVPVLLYVNDSGKITPVKIKIKTNDGTEWVKIEKITASCRRASLRGGSVGIRYSCVVNSQEKREEMYLFDEGDKWFIVTNS